MAIDAAQAWIENFRKHEKEYETATHNLKDNQVSNLNRQLQGKKTRLSQIKGQIRDLQARQERRRILLIKRNELLNQMESEKDRISAKREQQAKSMSTALEKKVLVSIRQNGNREAYKSFFG